MRRAHCSAQTGTFRPSQGKGCGTRSLDFHRVFRNITHAVVSVVEVMQLIALEGWDLVRSMICVHCIDPEHRSRFVHRSEYISWCTQIKSSADAHKKATEDKVIQLKETAYSQLMWINANRWESMCIDTNGCASIWVDMNRAMYTNWFAPNSYCLAIGIALVVYSIINAFW